MLSVLVLPVSASADPENILGNIDSAQSENGQVVIRGWACQRGEAESILVHLYIGHSAYDHPKGEKIASGSASLASERAVNDSCEDGGGNHHRFMISIPQETANQYHDKPIFVHGIRLSGSMKNAAISGSGRLRIPSTKVVSNFQDQGSSNLNAHKDTFPKLPGTFRDSIGHPSVFVTLRDLQAMVNKINVKGSFSAGMFSKLSELTKTDLAANRDWSATYSGCDIDIYLHAFSIESTGG